MRKVIILALILSNVLFAQNPGDIIITEWMANPNSLSDELGEYFELYNTTNHDINIDGWIIKDDGSNTHTINNGGTLNIPANGFVTLARSSTPGFPPDYVYSSFVLGNSSDEIVLLNGSTEIARVNYADGDLFGAGVSAELNDIVNHNNGVTQETDYVAATQNYNGDLGSPGEFGGTLPVELTTFSATISEGVVNLKWETATEINNYGFEVERRTVSDNYTKSEWIKLGFIQGYGNSNSPKNYTFRDELKNINGKYEYRLKQIDIDGKYEYSQIIEVELNIPLEFELSQNYPNPFNPTTTINFTIPQSTEVSLEVFNILGQKVANLVNEELGAGNYVINFSAEKFASGIYYYKLETPQYSSIKRMILLK